VEYKPPRAGATPFRWKMDIIPATKSAELAAARRHPARVANPTAPGCRATWHSLRSATPAARRELQKPAASSQGQNIVGWIFTPNLPRVTCRWDATAVSRTAWPSRTPTEVFRESVVSIAKQLEKRASHDQIADTSVATMRRRLDETPLKNASTVLRSGNSTRTIAPQYSEYTEGGASRT